LYGLWASREKTRRLRLEDTLRMFGHGVAGKSTASVNPPLGVTVIERAW
jgi:methyl coenzyme M reductase gamma subunit